MYQLRVIWLWKPITTQPANMSTCHFIINFLFLEREIIKFQILNMSKGVYHMNPPNITVPPRI